MQHDVVKNYYGKVLKTNADLKTSACCGPEVLPPHMRPLAENLHPEVTSKYYGCGLVTPAAIRGRRVLDLGSGGGVDVLLSARRVAPNGRAYGLDMTDDPFMTKLADVFG